MKKGNVILVNKAIADKKKNVYIFVPVERYYVETSAASLIPPPNRYISYIVNADSLDNILSEFGIKSVDLLKIDVEGYVLNALPGMMATLKKTQWLFIELLGQDISCIKTLRKIGFHLKAQHGKNFLFKKAT
jgi:FkbM family methyltransferase